AAILFASLARTAGFVVPAASAEAAAEAAVSAAPCIVRLVRYQFAASVPRPANPITAGSDSARIMVTPPVRSVRTLRKPVAIAPRIAHNRPRRCEFMILASFGMRDTQFG